MVSEHQLLDWLKEYYIGEQWGLKPGPAYQNAVQFLHKIRSYSNLLLERGEGQFGFIHLTFEEALAAYGLVSIGQVDFNRSLELIQSHLTEPAWYETIRLALGVWGILHRQPLVAGEVLQAMLKMECADKESCQNILMAGACLEDMGESGTGRHAADEVISALKITMGNRSLPPATQRVRRSFWADWRRSAQNFYSPFARIWTISSLSNQASSVLEGAVYKDFRLLILKHLVLPDTP